MYIHRHEGGARFPASTVWHAHTQAVPRDLYLSIKVPAPAAASPNDGNLPVHHQITSSS